MRKAGFQSPPSVDGPALAGCQRSQHLSLICNMHISITFNYKDLHQAYQAYRHKGVRGEGASLVEKAVR